MKVIQISSFIENRPGRLHSACAALAAKGVNLHNLRVEVNVVYCCKHLNSPHFSQRKKCLKIVKGDNFTI